MHSKILPRPLPVFPLPSHSSRTDVKTIAVGCSHGMITINSPTPPYTPVCKLERNTDERTFSFVSGSTRVGEIAFWGNFFRRLWVDGRWRKARDHIPRIPILSQRLAEFSIFFSAPQPFT